MGSYPRFSPKVTNIRDAVAGSDIRSSRKAVLEVPCKLILASLRVPMPGAAGMDGGDGGGEAEYDGSNADLMRWLVGDNGGAYGGVGPTGLTQLGGWLGAGDFNDCANQNSMYRYLQVEWVWRSKYEQRDGDGTLTDSYDGWIKVTYDWDPLRWYTWVKKTITTSDGDFYQNEMGSDGTFVETGDSVFDINLRPYVNRQVPLSMIEVHNWYTAGQTGLYGPADGAGEVSWTRTRYYGLAEWTSVSGGPTPAPITGTVYALAELEVNFSKEVGVIDGSEFSPGNYLKWLIDNLETLNLNDTTTVHTDPAGSTYQFENNYAYTFAMDYQAVADTMQAVMLYTGRTSIGTPSAGDKPTAIVYCLGEGDFSCQQHISAQIARISEPGRACVEYYNQAPPVPNTNTPDVGPNNGTPWTLDTAHAAYFPSAFADNLIIKPSGAGILQFGKSYIYRYCEKFTRECGELESPPCYDEPCVDWPSECNCDPYEFGI